MSKSHHVRIKCNACGSLFNVSVHSDFSAGRGVVIKYIECSKCNQKFLVQISDFDFRAYLNSTEFKLDNPTSLDTAHKKEQKLIIKHSALLKRLGIESDHILFKGGENT